jgi:hypothetical protein
VLARRYQSTANDVGDCPVCHREDHTCSLESLGVSREDSDYLARKVTEGDVVAIRHYLRGVDYGCGRQADVTLPSHRQQELNRVRIRRTATLLRELARHIEG